jgi:outer membrane protein assembly factor BamB
MDPVGRSWVWGVALVRDVRWTRREESPRLVVLDREGTLVGRSVTEGEVALDTVLPDERGAYVAGSFEGLVRVGAAEWDARGAREAFVARLSPTGEARWNYQTGAPISYSSPTVGQNAMVYVGSRDGKLYAIDCDGRLKWDFETQGPIGSSSVAIGADGTVYVGSDDGNLYAIGE